MQAEFGHIILIRDLKDSPTGDTIRSTTKIDYFHSELCFNLLYSNHGLRLVAYNLLLTKQSYFKHQNDKAGQNEAANANCD